VSCSQCINLRLGESSPGHSRPGRASSKAGHVRYAAESGSKFGELAAPQRPLRIDGTAVHVIQAPKPEPRIMRYELSDDKTKQCRRVAIRYDKLSANYLTFIKLASIRI
jgi:transposase